MTRPCVRGLYDTNLFHQAVTNSIIPKNTAGENGTAIRTFAFVPDLLLGCMFAVALFSSYERNPV